VCGIKRRLDDIIRLLKKILRVLNAQTPSPGKARLEIDVTGVERKDESWL
jgi:ribosome maturation factor RimP